MAKGKKYMKQVTQSWVEELQTVIFWRDLTCEWLGTCLLTFVANIVMVQLQGSEETTRVQQSLATGFYIVAICETFLHISGANINPAVSFVMWLRPGRVLSTVKAVCYIIIQCIGGITGAYMIMMLTPSDRWSKIGVPSINPTLQVWQGVASEMIATGLLILVIMGANDKELRYLRVNMPTVAVGFMVAYNMMILGRFSGSCMNPAVSFGLSVRAGNWTNHWVYWVGPMGGAFCGFIIYSSYHVLGVRDKAIKQAAAKAEESEQDLKKDNGVAITTIDGSNMKGEFENHHF